MVSVEPVEICDCLFERENEVETQKAGMNLGKNKLVVPRGMALAYQQFKYHTVVTLFKVLICSIFEGKGRKKSLPRQNYRRHVFNPRNYTLVTGA